MPWLKRVEWSTYEITSCIWVFSLSGVCARTIVSSKSDHVAVLGQVPWMHDLIALLPQPGPIITFQKVSGGLPG